MASRLAALRRPQNFQKTRKTRARKMAPPTPHTTPMTVRRVDALIPPPVLGSVLMGCAVFVGTRVVLTFVLETAWPSIVVTKTVVYACVATSVMGSVLWRLVVVLLLEGAVVTMGLFVSRVVVFVTGGVVLVANEVEDDVAGGVVVEEEEDGGVVSGAAVEVLVDEGVTTSLLVAEVDVGLVVTGGVVSVLCVAVDVVAADCSAVPCRATITAPLPLPKLSSTGARGIKAFPETSELRRRTSTETLAGFSWDSMLRLLDRCDPARDRRMLCISVSL